MNRRPLIKQTKAMCAKIDFYRKSWGMTASNSRRYGEYIAADHPIIVVQGEKVEIPFFAAQSYPSYQFYGLDQIEKWISICLDLKR